MAKPFNFRYNIIVKYAGEQVLAGTGRIPTPERPSYCWLHNKAEFYYITAEETLLLIRSITWHEKVHTTNKAAL